MDYFEVAKQITREAVKQMSMMRCDVHGSWDSDVMEHCPRCELFECEWCGTELSGEREYEKHADNCDRLYLAKW